MKLGRTAYFCRTRHADDSQARPCPDQDQLPVLDPSYVLLTALPLLIPTQKNAEPVFQRAAQPRTGRVVQHACRANAGGPERRQAEECDAQCGQQPAPEEKVEDVHDSAASRRARLG